MRKMKGNKVQYLSQMDVHETAHRFCIYLKVNSSTLGNFEQFLESLYDELKICVDPVDDREWPHFAEATCDPTTFHILLPDSSYLRACQGDHAAITTIFHEIGHLILGHRALLHKLGDAAPLREEDAEWQADEFAAYVANRMKIVPWQMSLDLRSSN